ncbi:MAG TPA: OmpA family protein [Gammaproteobacteria bacterium]|nr:OmpA family protein [Gammaproteobacteria bacterium]
MRLRFAALITMAILAAGCQSGPTDSAWLMENGRPWIAVDGGCVQLRPLKEDDKQGFCYELQSGRYQQEHHYEAGREDELGFLYPHVTPTPATAQVGASPPGLAPLIAPVDLEIPPLPYMQQLYTALPFKFNRAHLSAKNRAALKVSFKDWQARGMQVVSVDITGHTDAIGPEDYNFLLSKWRAESVAYYLRRLGIPKGDIQLGGAGELLPHPGAHSAADNRYVDLRVWLRPGSDYSDKMAMR